MMSWRLMAGGGGAIVTQMWVMIPAPFTSKIVRRVPVAIFETVVVAAGDVVAAHPLALRPGLEASELEGGAGHPLGEYGGGRHEQGEGKDQGRVFMASSFGAAGRRLEGL